MENEKVDKVQTRSSRIKTKGIKNLKEAPKPTCKIRVK